MKFGSAVLLSLATASTHAFYIPKPVSTRGFGTSVGVGSWDNDDFLEGLGSGNQQERDDESRDGDQGGSRLKEIMAKAQQAKSAEPAAEGFRPIENPFLTPPTTSTQNTNLEGLSLEEQARRFREMMQNGEPPARAPLPSPQNRSDRGPRPEGRNRDADTISNTADLYFAQLKRDSSVRGIARIHGDDETAQKVFADEGIKELESMVYENPYLKGQRDKERGLFDTVPEELIKPYFDPDKLPENERTTAGISYRELIKRRQQEKNGGGQQQVSQVASQPVQNIQTSAEVVEQPIPPPPQPILQPPPPQPQQVAPPRMAPQQLVVSGAAASNPEDTKRKIRTLMGMLLKHRGGPGFGKGRLSGREIDQFNTVLQDVVGLLQEEASQTATSQPVPTMNQVPVSPQQSFVPPTATAAPAQSSQLDSMVACIDGAITMYKNCPPELQSSVLTTLRAALASAVSTCDGVIGYQDQNPAPVMSQVEGTIAVIEGAVMMYRNSPPELQPSVLVTLRSALRAAVGTCDAMMGGVPPQSTMPSMPVQPAMNPPQAQPVVPTPPVEVPPQAAATPPSPVIPATDPNSKVLDEVYNKMKAAAGDGSLGLRSDLTSEDASELADKLKEMRAVLMDELDTGIPDANAEQVVAATSPSLSNASPGEKGSTMSRYQEMLAKAKAEKAAGK